MFYLIGDTAPQIRGIEATLVPNRHVFDLVDISLKVNLSQSGRCSGYQAWPIVDHTAGPSYIFSPL
jgi:hypothetical protein